MKQRNTAPESAQAKSIAAALKNCGIPIKHTQALKVVAQLNGSSNWNTLRAKVSKTVDSVPMDLQTLARQHVSKAMFETLGKWDLDSFFDELKATLAMDEMEQWQPRKHRMNKLFDVAHHEGVAILEPYYQIPTQELPEFFESEVARTVDLLTTRWFAPAEVIVDRALSPSEMTHVIAVEDTDYENECVVRTASGFQLRSPAYPEPASYLRVCDPLGREIAYWNSDEIREDAEDVIGAVLGALRPGNPALGSTTPASEEDRCILDKRVVDWLVSDNEAAKPAFREDIPAHRFGAYRMEIFDNVNQFRVALAPRHRTPQEFDDKKLNGLDLFIEVNEGVPCVHISNDPYGDMVLSIFGTKEGLLVRRQDNELRFKAGADHPLAKLVNAERDLFVPHPIGA